MQKTTVYLPDDMKLALTRVADGCGMSEAQLIREALRLFILQAAPPTPRVPLFKSGQPDLAERIDQALLGFGES